MNIPKDALRRALRGALPLAAIAAVLVASACGDETIVAPAAASRATPRLHRQFRMTNAVQILRRTRPLDKPLTTSAIIAPSGGHIDLPRAGLRLDFAPGALAEPTLITLTAHAGSQIAYEFEPHGLTFLAPVTVSQSLRHTAAEHDPRLAARLQGSYYEGSLDSAIVDSGGRYARIKETRKARVDSRGMLRFDVRHFSGYMISTGLISVAVHIDIFTR
jgi:hypothetical protein